MTVHFCVHDEGDSVGVVVVEGIKSGQEESMITKDVLQGTVVGGRAIELQFAVGPAAPGTPRGTSASL